MMTSDNQGNANPNDIKVSSVIELKETFETFRETIAKKSDNKTIMELVLNLLCLYSESTECLISIAIEHTIPSIQLIVNATAQNEQDKQLSRSKFSQILDCLLAFLQMKENRLLILRQFDLP